MTSVRPCCTRSPVIGFIQAIQPAGVVRRRLVVLSHPPGRPIWTPAIENGDVAPVHSDRSGARTDQRKTAIAAPLGEVLAITTLDPGGAAAHARYLEGDGRHPGQHGIARVWKGTGASAGAVFGCQRAGRLSLAEGEAAERAASVFIGRQRPEMLIRAATLRGRRHRSADCRVPGHHYEFLRAPDATAKRVREFLLSVK